MTTLTLERFSYGANGTFGILTRADGKSYFTVERPWIDNKPWESCVPEGLYQLVKEATTTSVPESYNRKTWYLQGGSVGLYKGHRTRIAIHIANLPREVQGCIGVGIGLTALGGEWAVSSSRTALEELQPTFQGAHALRITHKPAAGETLPDDPRYWGR